MKSAVLFLFVLFLSVPMFSQGDDDGLRERRLRPARWMVAALEIEKAQKAGVKKPSIKDLKVTNFQEEGRNFMEISVDAEALTLPAGYRLVLALSNDKAFDRLSFSKKFPIQGKRAKALAEGAFKLTVSEIAIGYVRLEVRSDNNYVVESSDVKQLPNIL